MCVREKGKKIFNLIKRYRYFLVFAIVLFSFNAYAWFMYATRVDTSLTAKVRSWNVMFQVHDNNIAENITFDMADMYPGMPNYSDAASIINTGDSTADAYFNIKRFEIFGDVYTSENYTQAQLLDRLENSYPFKIQLSLTNTKVYPGATELFQIAITWPYESNNDTLDTQWGMKAYEYRNNRPGQPCLSILAEIRVDQSQIQE